MEASKNGNIIPEGESSPSEGSDQEKNDKTADGNVFEKGFTEDYLNLLQASMINDDDFNEDDSYDEEAAEFNFVEPKNSNNIEINSEEINNANPPQAINSRKKLKRARVKSPESIDSGSKRKKKDFQPPKIKEPNRDIFCWRCHKFGGGVISCNICPRVFHLKCSHLKERPSKEWICTECDLIASAEKDMTRNPATMGLTTARIACLLEFVLKRMRNHEGSFHFENLVDPDQYPDYKDYVVNPMYLKLLETKIKNCSYSNCELFLADAKWMVHNSYIFNTAYSELTVFARGMLKHAKHECEEILNCPDCYFHANTLLDTEWFIEPCDTPHILVWARLKGWPYWPCKVMKASGNNVDVRFFGDHNKSVVPVESCYLYSIQAPSKQKKVPDLDKAIKEALDHIGKLEFKFGEYRYAPHRTKLNPREEAVQRKLLLPHFVEGMTSEEASEIRAKARKEDCKVTIVLPGSAQRNRSSNSTVTSTNDRSGEISRPIETSPNVASHLYPILSRKLLPKKSPQTSCSSIVIEEDDTSDDLQENSCGFQMLPDNSNPGPSGVHLKNNKTNKNSFPERDISETEVNNINESTKNVLDDNQPKSQITFHPKLIQEKQESNEINIDKSSKNIQESTESQRQVIVPPINEFRKTRDQKFLQKRDVSIDLVCYRMLSEEFDECLKDVEKVISKPEDVIFVRSKFQDLEDRLLAQLEKYEKERAEDLEKEYPTEKTKHNKNLYTWDMVQEIKKKQWCVSCFNEAKFRCCWPTCYCSARCQLNDWPLHRLQCQKINNKNLGPDGKLPPSLVEILRNENEENTTLRKASSSESSCSRKQLLLTYPGITSQGSTLVSVGQACPPRSLSRYTIAGSRKPQMVLMGRNKFVLPNDVSTANLFGKTVAISRQTTNEVPQNHLVDSRIGSKNVVITLPSKSPSSQIGSSSQPASKQKAYIVFDKNPRTSSQCKIRVADNLVATMSSTKSSESSEICVASTSQISPSTMHRS